MQDTIEIPIKLLFVLADLKKGWISLSRCLSQKWFGPTILHS